MADETNAARVTFVTDLVGEHCQKLFYQFIDQFKVNGKQKYMAQVQNLAKSEKNTIRVRFSDVDTFKPDLAAAILSEYYRVNPFLSNAVRQYAEEKLQLKITKDVFISFVDVSVKRKLRELGTAQIGKLLQITGQVVRTHPVHPELVSGTFLCLECQTVVGNVEQQFKYTQPPVCRNQVCANRANFELVPHRSKFVDFQKVRIQETQAELPRGSIPRSLEVILRAEAVESCQPGDKCGFIGTLIVVPHVAALIGPGVSADSGRPGRAAEGLEATEGSVRGLKALGTRDLSYRLAFLACAVVPSAENKTSAYWSTVLQRSVNDLDDADADADDTAENLDESMSSSAGIGQANSAKRINELAIATMKKQLSDAEWARIYTMSRDPRIYSNLCASLFPSVHGNEEVKQGIILMLFGGVPKQTPDGTRLRGDVNVCLVGDPSTAKSQFLKQVEAFCPRAIYTSGKASSAAGLTAAVVRDEETFEFVIEAGALILADNGVCCIDEFDKMELRDQVAIHEAMEQQTISITKAGVKATLNARTSVLAAANPVGGRYDRSKPLKFNINLSEPIKSRFDLFFVLIDECNEVTDYAIASKIVHLHKAKTQGGALAAPAAQNTDGAIYTADEIARYIAFARQFRPRIGRDAMRLLVDYYKTMRTREATQVYGGRAAGGAFGLASGATASRVTVRQLESLIRLSEALAKLYFADQVAPAHVREAYRLLNKSIIRVEQPDIQLEDDSVLPDVPLLELAAGGEQQQQGEMDTDGQQGADRNADAGVGLFMDLDDNLNRSGDDEALSRGDAAAKQKLAKAKQAGQTKQVRIGFDEYKRLATMLIIRIRKLEEEVELLEEIEAPRSQIDETLVHMRREELVNWYLREVEAEIADERELVERKLVIDKVIDRLVKHDSVLLELKGGSKLSGGPQPDAAAQTDSDENPLLIVHPNYSLE